MTVGGTATSRGIAFQHAQAVVACVQALESADIEFLRVEGVEDIVDFELCRTDRTRLRVCQAKTRREPYTWSPGEIVSTIVRWQELPDADNARFEFLTDGSAGPELADRLQPALRRAQKGALTDDDVSYLRSKGLVPDDALLTRIAIESRQPDADALLDRASLRLLRLLEIGSSDASTARADGLIDALFRMVALRAGKGDADDRVITRAELSEVAGIALESIDSTRAWDDAVRDAYIAALQAQPPHPSYVMLQAQEIASPPAALALVVRQTAEPSSRPRPQPATELLDTQDGAVLSGGPGTGKSTTLELLVPAAIGLDLLPVLMSAEGYEAGGMVPLVRDAVERRLGYRLGPNAVSAILGAENVVLLVDGAGELQQEARESLLVDLQRIRREHRQLRVIATSRDPARLRALGLPSFVLQQLDGAQRRRIAEELLGVNSEPLVRNIEARLGDIVTNPLLFVMALSLAKEGVYADTRAELFDRFIEGIAAREGGDQLSDIVMALIRAGSFQLRSEDTYVADPWTWRRLFAGGLAHLAELKLFAAESVSADEVLQRAHGGGVLRVIAGSGLVGLTHDLFCDFFAAEAIRTDQADLPSVLPESLEEAAVFLAERGSLTAAQARVVATSPVAAARCAAAEPPSAALCGEEATQLLALLAEHLGERVASHLVGSHLRAVNLDDGAYLFVLPTTEDDGASEVRLEEAAAVARRVVKAARGTSILGAAVAVWLTQLRMSLAERPEGLVLPIPAERDQLPATLESAFAERKREVSALLADVCPGLTHRVLRELGMRGFHGMVGPIRRSPAPPVGGDIVEHPLTFTFNADDVSVRLADAVDRNFVEEPATMTTCEGWLRDAPATAARADVIAALSKLLPGFGS